jgi:hypothetical protein
MHSFSSSATASEWRRSSTIGLELDEANQLFNSLDLSPIQNKDLSPEVEEFIVCSAQEHAPGEALTLRIRVGKWPGQDPSDLIRQSIHNYFAYRAQMNHLEFRRVMKPLMRRSRICRTIKPGPAPVSTRWRPHLAPHLVSPFPLPFSPRLARITDRLAG